MKSVTALLSILIAHSAGATARLGGISSCCGYAKPSAPFDQKSNVMTCRGFFLPPNSASYVRLSIDGVENSIAIDVRDENDVEIEASRALTLVANALTKQTNVDEQVFFQSADNVVTLQTMRQKMKVAFGNWKGSLHYDSSKFGDVLITGMFCEAHPAP